MKKILLLFAIFFAIPLAWGAETTSWTHGFETGTAWGGTSTSNRAVNATAKRTGTQGHYATASAGGGRLIKGGAVNYDKDNTYTVMCWMKLNVAGKAGINVAAAGGNDFDIEADTWTLIYKQFTAASTQTGKNIQATCSIGANCTIYVDDIVYYKGTVDLVKPSAPTAASGITTAISWTNGTDDNTGIQNTLIWHRTSGTDEDLTLNDQGVYAAGDLDESGHWTLVTASVEAAATSYDGTFSEHDVYAIVHHDWAFNYSSAAYVTITNPLSDWTIVGQFFKKEGDEFALPTGMTQSGDIASTTIHMYANGRCEFHLEKDGNKYTNWAAIPTDRSGITLTMGDGPNCVLYPGPEGDYTITFNTTTHEVSVIFPTVEHPCANYVYFVKPDDWNCVRIYNYTSDAMRMSDWNGSPYITTTATICDTTYYYCAAYPAFFNYVIWRDDNGHQSNSLNTAAGLGNHFNFAQSTTSWKTFGISSITFNNNGGEGSMAAITHICPKTDQALPACTFVKSGYNFSHWTANVDLKIGGVTVAAGQPINDGATLQQLYNKQITLTAVWEEKPPTFIYILGYCYVKNHEWIQGSDGAMKAWQYVPVGESLKETEDILFDLPDKGGTYFNSKDLTLLDVAGTWGASSTDNRAIKAFTVAKGKTQTFDLNGMEACKITFYAFPNSNDAYSIDLTVNGSTTTKSFVPGSKDTWHKYVYEGSTYTGEFSIAGGTKDTKMVVIVEVPQQVISFNNNGGTGSMPDQIVPKGATWPLDLNLFTRTDYLFKGWAENPSGTGTLYADEAPFRTLTNVTLYAQWEEIIKSTIILNATGAYNAYTSSVVAYYLQPMPEITTLPLRAGYVFDGYYDAPDGAGTQYYTGLGNGVRNWDKTTSPETLYAKWLEPCDLVPTLTNITPIVTIWDRKKVDEGVVRLTCDYDTTGISYSLLSAVPSEPLTGDLHFEYFDEQIHLMGTSDFGNVTEKTITVTFTIANNCNPEHTYTITSTIRIYPQNQKAKIAFIITGTKNGAFTAYSADDADDCNDLVTYLSTYFDITYVNGYATKDEASLAAYYAQYDLLIVTDFLNTGEGYTNAIGTLIDKKPILSFEAYVANQSNWHIGSNPKDPKPKVQDMKVLCAGHAIFKDAKYNPSDATETEVVRTDTTVHVLDALSSEKKAKGLQGFTINEAPDFIFLATVRDENNNRDLIVCCERQMVFPARLLIYGINFYEMGNLSKAGKIIMRQMIDYLLMTDETKIADCSLIFDNGFDSSTGTTVAGGGDHLWSNPKNWSPGRNIIPTPYHPTRIIAECWVNIDNAHAGSVKVNKGRDEHNNPVDGKLIVKPYGGLTIAGMVTTVHNTRYASPITIKAEDLIIESDETHNGGFVYGNKESDVRATVEYYSRAEGSSTTSPIWQYIGIPFQPGKTAINLYHYAWMCRWTTASDGSLGGLWQWVQNEDVLLPFEGYCITQESRKTYDFTGKLNPPVTTTLSLDNRDADGFAFVANSWTAPIKISQMEDGDFINTEKAIYIYHTGSYAAWDTNKDEIINTEINSNPIVPGQYAVVPIHSSPYIGVDSVIPSMQGFFVQTTSANAKLKLVYNRVVYDATYFKTSTQPMRAPRRSSIEVMQLTVSGDSYGDRVHLLARGGFSEEYEDGWDGRKIDGDAAAPKLAVLKTGGEMAVAAIPTLEGRYLSFQAGDEIEYTFSFNYEGDEMYLYDLVTEQATLIQTGNTYTFSAVNKTPQRRFLITANPPRVATDVENIDAERVQRAEKFIQEGQLRILLRGIIYDALGKRISERREAQP